MTFENITPAETLLPCDRCGEPVTRENRQLLFARAHCARAASVRAWAFCSEVCRAEWYATPEGELHPVDGNALHEDDREIALAVELVSPAGVSRFEQTFETPREVNEWWEAAPTEEEALPVDRLLRAAESEGERVASEV